MGQVLLPPPEVVCVQNLKLVRDCCTKITIYHEMVFAPLPPNIFSLCGVGSIYNGPTYLTLLASQVHSIIQKHIDALWDGDFVMGLFPHY